jgi:primosomal protein N''
MIFVQGESATVAKLKIKSTFQSLLPDEDLAREYLNEVSRDLDRLKEQDSQNRWTIVRETLAANRLAEQIYDIDSLNSIQETIIILYKQLKPLPPRSRKELIVSWSLQLTVFAGIIMLAIWLVN